MSPNGPRQGPRADGDGLKPWVRVVATVATIAAALLAASDCRLSTTPEETGAAPPTPTASRRPETPPTQPTASATQASTPVLLPSPIVGSAKPPPVTPTFTPWFPYRVIDRGSKLGIHALSPRGVLGLHEQMLAAGAYFPVVKAVDDLGWLRDIKELSPGTITLARVTGPGENITDSELRSGDLQAIAERVMAHLALAAAEHGGYVDYWEPTNELDPPGPELYARFAQLHIHMMDIAEASGYRIGLFSFNVGTPEWDEMVAIAETGVFARARRGGHIITLHEGVFGDVPIDYLWGEPIPGAPAVEGAGPLCFRYRYLYHLLEQRDEVVPLVVSELVFGAGYEGDGVPAEEISFRSRWYDNRARQDYYVWAFLPFTIGTYEGTWEHASYEYAYPLMVERSLRIEDKWNAVPEGP